MPMSIMAWKRAHLRMMRIQCCSAPQPTSHQLSSFKSIIECLLYESLFESEEYSAVSTKQLLGTRRSSAWPCSKKPVQAI